MRGPAKCGTPSGYMRHYRNNETICDPCRIAYNIARKASRIARGETTHTLVDIDAQCPKCGHYVADAVAEVAA